MSVKILLVTGQRRLDRFGKCGLFRSRYVFLAESCTETTRTRPEMTFTRGSKGHLFAPAEPGFPRLDKG